MKAPAWWGSPAGAARRPYAPSLVDQLIGVAIGAWHAVGGPIFSLTGAVFGIRTLDFKGVAK